MVPKRAHTHAHAHSKRWMGHDEASSKSEVSASSKITAGGCTEGLGMHQPDLRGGRKCFTIGLKNLWDSFMFSEW